MGRHRTRRAFTLIELMVAVSILSLAAAMLYPSYASTWQQANDKTAIGLADQLAANLQRYMGWTGTYPASLPATRGSGGWTSVIQALGTYAELPSTIPPILASGNFQAYSNAAGSTFQIEFKASGGTGTAYCRAPNGLATITWSDSAGPWTGCP